MTSVPDRPRASSSRAARLALRPAVFVPLSPQQRRDAIDALAALLAPDAAPGPDPANGCAEDERDNEVDG